MKKICSALVLLSHPIHGAYAQKTTLTVYDYIDATAPGYAENEAIWQSSSMKTAISPS